jgi:hypothetical protein
VTILDAMESPDLFGPFFQGTHWRAWKAFLGAVFGLPLGPNLRAIYEKHTERSELPTALPKEAYMEVGRRGGKSRIAAFMATYVAAFRDYHPYLAPGELALIPVLASDMDQAGAIFGYVNGFVENIPALRPLIAGKPTGQRVVFHTGVEIKVRAATFRGLRGRPIPLALGDEIAFWRNEESRNPDHEILRAILPGMLTIPDSLFAGLSSPYARRGLLWDRHKAHYGKNNPRVLIWKASTLDMNPTADREEIALAYEDDPISAAAEYGGEFRRDLEAYVPQEVVDAAMEGQPPERLPMAGVTYHAFTDPSGGSADSFTLAIAHKLGDRGVLDRVLEERPPFSPEGVVAKFCEVLRAYGITIVHGDHYAGEWPREQFAKHGVTYRVADQSKSELYLAFLPALMSERVDLIASPRLTNQFCALDRRTSRAGRDSVDHPPGGHDDVANAVAGVLAPLVGGINTGSGALEFMTEALARGSRKAS